MRYRRNLYTAEKCI